LLQNVNFLQHLLALSKKPVSETGFNVNVKSLMHPHMHPQTIINSRFLIKSYIVLNIITQYSSKVYPDPK